MQRTQQAHQKSPAYSTIPSSKQTSNESSSETKTKNIILATLFITFLLGFVALYLNMPAISSEDRAELFSTFPTTGKDVQNIHSIISRYYETNQIYVHALFCYLYVFLQSFALPGPLILSLLSGALFGFARGFIIVTLVKKFIADLCHNYPKCTITGATGCYTVSNFLGRGLILKYFPQFLEKFNGMVSKQKGNLFWYTLSLRFTPIVSNCFVNSASPIVGIPLKDFFFASIIGLMPANLLHVRAGLTLSEVGELGLNMNALLGLLGLGVLALVPVGIKKRMEKKFD